MNLKAMTIADVQKHLVNKANEAKNKAKVDTKTVAAETIIIRTVDGLPKKTSLGDVEAYKGKHFEVTTPFSWKFNKGMSFLLSGAQRWDKLAEVRRVEAGKLSVLLDCLAECFPGKIVIVDGTAGQLPEETATKA